MRTRLVCFFAAALMMLGACGHAHAQDNSVLPKYGPVALSAAQQAAHREFVEGINLNSGGDLKRAARDFAMRGWQAANQGQADEAMRRFNQAWLLDKASALALWGMAATQVNKPGKAAAALPLFAEAQKAGVNEINFQVDYAKAVGLAAAQTGNAAMMQDAFARFARIHAKAPGHTLNLQNWAVTLYFAGDYAQAWQKVVLAEATPDRGRLDPKFLAALKSKMPRP